jgi:proteasome assembly chaperone (PAC2) family protein
MNGRLERNKLPELHNSSLLVGWSEDAGRLGEEVIDYIIEKLGGYPFHEIEPEDYFQLGGVTIENDLVQFPESKFYICPNNNLMIFKSSPPHFEEHKFFNQVLDVAEYYGKITDVYTIGGMVSLSAHTLPRRLLGTFSSFEVKDRLTQYGIDTSPDYETTPGQKPTLNSLFLWAIQKRNLTGIDLWVPIPFYLVSVDDAKSQKRILEFLNRRFNLGIDLSGFDEVIKKQNQKINEARNVCPDINDYLAKVEGNLRLSEDETLKLTKQLEEYLK